MFVKTQVSLFEQFGCNVVSCACHTTQIGIKKKGETNRLNKIFQSQRNLPICSKQRSMLSETTIPWQTQLLNSIGIPFGSAALLIFESS